MLYVSFFSLLFKISRSVDAHAIYLLNLLLAFLQPKFDPSLQDDLMADEIEEGVDSSTPSPLPSQRDDEFRPFVRRLPEWQFWSVILFALLSSIHTKDQALLDESNSTSNLLYDLRNFRRASILAYSRDLLLRPLCLNYATSDPVRAILLHFVFMFIQHPTDI